MKKLLAILMMFSVYAMGAETTPLPLPTTGNVTLTLASTRFYHLRIATKVFQQSR